MYTNNGQILEGIQKKIVFLQISQNFDGCRQNNSQDL